jgi:hypothetical protein
MRSTQPAPIAAERAGSYQRTTLVAKRKGSGRPQGLKLLRRLGKGANNAAYQAKLSGIDVVYREPRTNSDTQRIANAEWEFRNSVIAASVEAGPLVYDAWYTRHSTKQQRAGLHMVTEYFPGDLHELIIGHPEQVARNWDALRSQTVGHLRRMAEAHLLSYDLKPANMVMRMQPFDVRFIDFGRDFCEWRPYQTPSAHVDRAPLLSFVQQLADAHTTDRVAADVLYTTLIFAVMAIVLSANMEFTLQQSSTAMRASRLEGCSLNFMFDVCANLRRTMDPATVRLIREILRQRDLRDTLRHYIGRRNSGTQRTFAYAGFRLPSQLRAPA